MQYEVKEGNIDRIESEFGDVLFSLINYARFININPIDALEKTNKRFKSRFQIMEKLIQKENLFLMKWILSKWINFGKLQRSNMSKAR